MGRIILQLISESWLWILVMDMGRGLSMMDVGMLYLVSSGLFIESLNKKYLRSEFIIGYEPIGFMRPM